MFEPHGAPAELLDLLNVVRDEQHRGAAAHELHHAALALFLELRVAHGEDLVHNQDLRLHHGGNGERQPRQHAGGIVADRDVNEVPQLGEVQDLLKLGVEERLCIAENRAVEVDILPAAQVHIETGAEFQHGHDIAAAFHRALRGLHDAGDDLQERALARAVAPDEADRLALLHLKRDVLQRGECAVLQLAAQRRGDKLLERQDLVVVHAEPHRHIGNADHCVVVHINPSALQIENEAVLRLAEDEASHQKHSQRNEHTLQIGGRLRGEAVQNTEPCILNEVIERIDCEHKAEVFRQDALRVKDRRRIHPDHAQDVPQKLHITEEHHGGGEQQAESVGKQDETEQEEKGQDNGLSELHAGEHAHEHERNQGNAQVDHRGHDARQRIHIFRHIDFCNQAGVPQDGGERHAAGFRKEVERHDADQQIGRVIRNVRFENSGKDKILDNHGQQRIEKAPEHTEDRSLVLRLEIAGHELADEEAVFLHGMSCIEQIAALACPAALPEHKQEQEDQHRAGGAEFPIVQARPDVILTGNGIAQRACGGHAVQRELRGFQRLLRVCLREGGGHERGSRAPGLGIGREPQHERHAVCRFDRRVRREGGQASLCDSRGVELAAQQDRAGGRVDELHGDRPGIRAVIGAPLDGDRFQPLDAGGKALLHHRTLDKLHRAALSRQHLHIAVGIAVVQLVACQKIKQADQHGIPNQKGRADFQKLLTLYHANKIPFTGVILEKEPLPSLRRPIQSLPDPAPPPQPQFRAGRVYRMLRAFLPADVRLLCFELALHRLLDKQIKVRFDPCTRGLVQLFQAARIALFLRYAGGRTDPVDLLRDIRPAHRFSAAGQEERPVINSAAGGIVQQFLLQAAGQAQDLLVVAGLDFDTPGFHRFHRHLGHFQNGNARGCEQLNQKIFAFPPQRAGGAQQAQIFRPADLRQILVFRPQLVVQLVFFQSQVAEQAVGRRNAQVHRPGRVAAGQQFFPVPGQRVPVDAFILRQIRVKLPQILFVAVHRALDVVLFFQMGDEAVDELRRQHQFRLPGSGRLDLRFLLFHDSSSLPAHTTKSIWRPQNPKRIAKKVGKRRKRGKKILLNKRLGGGGREKQANQKKFLRLACFPMQNGVKRLVIPFPLC